MSECIQITKKWYLAVVNNYKQKKMNLDWSKFIQNRGIFDLFGTKDSLLKLLCVFLYIIFIKYVLHTCKKNITKIPVLTL